MRRRINLDDLVVWYGDQWYERYVELLEERDRGIKRKDVLSLIVERLWRHDVIRGWSNVDPERDAILCKLGGTELRADHQGKIIIKDGKKVIARYIDYYVIDAGDDRIIITLDWKLLVYHKYVFYVRAHKALKMIIRLLRRYLKVRGYPCDYYDYHVIDISHVPAKVIRGFARALCSILPKPPVCKMCFRCHQQWFWDHYDEWLDHIRQLAEQSRSHTS